MRKTPAAILILIMVWIGYTVWPLYELSVLVHAIETRDVDTVTRHVYFAAVRRSLTSQVVAAYTRRTGIQMSPLAQSMAAAALGIADPVVKKLISPEALSELLAVGWPVTVVPDPPRGTVGISRSTIGSIWQIFGVSEYGVGRFEVSAPASLPPTRYPSPMIWSCASGTTDSCGTTTTPTTWSTGCRSWSSLPRRS